MPKYTIEFFQQFAVKKQGLCLSAEYQNGHTKLQWQCKDGHQWSAQPRKIVEGSWCPECHAKNCHKYMADNNFFASDSEESFYVAGFLAADGWKTRKSGGAYSIGLQLAKKDFLHLVRMRETMRADAKLFYKERKSPTTDNDTYSYQFTINSKQMYQDLERFGVIENKTYVYQLPDWLKSHPLVHHFLRGYVDGDGCFGFAQNKGQKQHVIFCMRGTAEFLQSFNDIMVESGAVEREHDISAKVGKKYAAFDRLQYSGNGVCSKLYNYLYKDATIFLERKQKIAVVSKALSVYGSGRRRSRKSTSLNITKEMLIEKAQELKSQKKIAEYFGCTPANISWLVKDYNMRKEMDKALGKVNEPEIIELYNILGTKAAVARHVGLTKTRIGQIIKQHESAANSI